MLGWLQTRRQLRQAARNWHDVILRTARERDLFADGIVADTFDGRFHMLTLVAVLALRRLRGEGETGRRLADRVYREVFSGLDHAMREEGVSDSSIARKMRGRGEAFFGLARAIDAALAPGADTDDLASVLARNAVTMPDKAGRLASWLRAQAGALDQTPPEAVLAGQPIWTKV